VTNDDSGTIAGNVSDVAVACSTNSYTIGGTVIELSGTVVLADNGGDNDTVTANGPYTFATPIASGMTYAVTVSTQPAAQVCLVAGATGTVTGSDTTTVDVDCDSGIKCGGAYCNPATQYCCGPEASPACHTDGMSCAQLELTCDNGEDCDIAGHPGYCCATIAEGGVEAVACSTTCGTNKLILCDPNLVGLCPESTACKAYSALAGYYACQ